MAEQRHSIDLNGTWEFRLDQHNKGLRDHWSNPHTSFPSSITVPGAWQQQGFGKPSAMLRHQYSGVAWYRKAVSVPETWKGQSVILRIGGAHRLTRVFVNGIDFGEHNGFNAPFSFDVTRAIKSGKSNLVDLRIDDPAMPVAVDPLRQKATLPTGMLNYIANWGGVYGDVTLEARDHTHIDSVLISSDTAKRIASFDVSVVSNKPRRISVRVSIPGTQPVTSELTIGTTRTAEATVEVPLPNAPMWSPESPSLLTATIQVIRNGTEVDSIKKRFGFRQISTRGNVLLLNGKPIYLRGYGDDNIEVLNGFPPASNSVCIDRMKLAKSFGFNAVRFHSMTPPECYFEAADEVGILIMAELPAAYTQFFFGQRDFLRGELRSTLLAYRNHPSLLSLAFGNEFNMRWLKTDADRKSMQESLREFYEIAKKLAPATLIMSNDGFDIRPTDMVSKFDPKPLDRPTILHEFGDYYDSLPDIGSINKFTGVIRPVWLENKKRWVTSNMLQDSYSKYLKNSIRLQQIGRKFQIERARSKNWITGYDYWLLVDFPAGSGEGDAWEEGWFDYFWHPKVSPEEGRELNSAVLPMIDAGVEDRSLWNDSEKKIGVSISNYGDGPIRDNVLAWTLDSDEQPIRSGAINAVNVDLGSVSQVGNLVLRAPADERPHKLELVVTLKTSQKTYSNRWSFWSFPKMQSLAAPAVPIIATAGVASKNLSYPWLHSMSAEVSPNAVVVTDRLTDAVRAHLRHGGKVVWMMTEAASVKGLPFLPASGGAVGTLIKQNGELGNFPNDGFCDLQFFNVLDGASPISLDAWPAELTPVISGIRTKSAFLSTQKDLSRVGYLVEVNADGGKMLITAPGMWKHLDSAHPDVVYLFDQLLRYTSSQKFEPKLTIPTELLNSLQP
jgi:hypothetical protein